MSMIIHHAPQSRSTRLLWLLEELGADYRIHYVDILRREGQGRTDPANPHPLKQAPALEVDGQVRTLRCTAADDPALALVATGFSYSSHWRAQQAELLTRLLPRVRDIRRMGAAALDFCRVAEGTVDAFYEHGLHCWDFAAGSLIAREAGAVVHTPRLSTPGSAGEAVSVAAGPLAAGWAQLMESVDGLRPLKR